MRNWKRVALAWLVLSVLGGAFVIVSFNNSDATALALRRARSNQALVELIGSPMKAGWFIGGSIEVTPGSGRADLAIPISGPKGNGTIYALAVKTAGLWKLTLLQFGADGSSERLELLQR